MQSDDEEEMGKLRRNMAELGKKKRPNNNKKAIIDPNLQSVIEEIENSEIYDQIQIHSSLEIRKMNSKLEKSEIIEEMNEMEEMKEKKENCNLDSKSYKVQIQAIPKKLDNIEVSKNKSFEDLDNKIISSSMPIDDSFGLDFNNRYYENNSEKSVGGYDFSFQNRLESGSPHYLPNSNNRSFKKTFKSFKGSSKKVNYTVNSENAISSRILIPSSRRLLPSNEENHTNNQSSDIISIAPNKRSRDSSHIRIPRNKWNHKTISPIKSEKVNGKLARNGLKFMNVHGQNKFASERFSQSCTCKNVMVVDDDPFNLLTMKLLLKNFDVEIFTADDGNIAVDLFKEKNKENVCKKCTFFAVIFMDMNMPIMNGSQASR